MLTTDFSLIVIMLVGLFRLRRHGGGWFDLGRLLWKQVGWWNVLPAASLLFRCHDFRPGVCHLAFACHSCRAHASSMSSSSFTPLPITL